MDKGNSNYRVSGDQHVSAVKRPDASRYVSRAIFSGKRPIDAGRVAKRIAAIKAAALKVKAESSERRDASC